MAEGLEVEVLAVGLHKGLGMSCAGEVFAVGNPVELPEGSHWGDLGKLQGNHFGLVGQGASAPALWPTGSVALSSLAGWSSSNCCFSPHCLPHSGGC